MQKSPLRLIALLAAVGAATLAMASDDPRVQRHELMEGVRDAAKPLGGMMRGEVAFDADTVAASLATFSDAASRFGSLFPEGSETGMDTEAAPAIWTDREGFEAALAKFASAVENARAAAPASLDAAKPVLGPVFQGCKGCHDNYRIDKD